MSVRSCLFGLLVAIILPGSLLFAQEPVPALPVSTTRELLGEALASPQPPRADGPAPVAAATAFAVMPRFDWTFLPGGGADGFGINDFEPGVKCTIPLGDAAPLWVTPGGARRLWSSPGADLPPQVVDLVVDLAWRPRLREWLFLDLAVTPGLYTDFHNLHASAFRPRGRALAIVALSERFQLVAGGLYTNRLRTLALPAGGVIWSPDDDTKLTLVFPAPKVARRLITSANGTAWWLYGAGEFGGGTWAIRRASGLDDAVDYSDLRLLLGVEARTSQGPSFHLEAGYVFHRRISFASSGTANEVRPADTTLIRAGWSY